MTTKEEKEAKGRWMRATGTIQAERVVVAAIMEERRRKKKTKRFKKACVKALKFALSTGGLMIINFIVMGVGGFIFSKLEIDNEIQGCKNAQLDYETAENNTLILIMDLAQTMQSSGPLSDEDLLEKQNQFRDNIRQFSLSVLDTGFQYDTDCENKEHNWRFLNSLLFAITIVTTIGYGHISPATMWGKLVCIAYSLIGIPVFMIALGNVGEILASLFRITYSTLCCCGCCRKKEEVDPVENMTEKDEEYVQKAATVWRLDPVTGKPIPPSEEDEAAIVETEEGEDEEDDEEEEEEALTVPLTITILMFLMYIVIGGVSFEMLEEDWDFVDALYYSTVTSTTVGFGDLVPNVVSFTDETFGFMIAKAVWTMIYIVLSLGGISMCLQLLADEIVAKAQWIGEKLGIKKKEDDEEDGDNEDKDEETELDDIEASKKKDEK